MKYLTREQMDRLQPGALGYTKNGQIYLLEGMDKDIEDIVLEHEKGHVERGEDGAFSLGSIIGGVVGSVLGGRSESRAAGRAAAQQAAAGERAIDFARESRDLARQDLSPFVSAGRGVLGGLSSLITNPQAQQNFITNNPFFSTLTDIATRNVFSNQAARGKLGSGGTLQSLQETLLKLGPDLVNQSINQRMELAGLGAQAAGNFGQIATQTGSTMADLATQIGNAQAAGTVGRANARSNMFNQIGTLLSDRRTKEDIKKVGKLDNGLPVYTYRYKGDNKLQIGVMAQDVEKKDPKAVHHFAGLKLVDIARATYAT